MLKLNLEAARKQPIQFDEELRLPSAQVDRFELLDLGPVRARGVLSPCEKGFKLEGEFEWKAEMQCSRCLATYSSPERVALDLILLPGVADEKEAVDFDRQDHDTAYFSGDSLDVTPIAEEQIQLAVPMKPLCSEDCRGLCPQCGANWNKGSCECEKPPDPRWGELVRFRSKLENAAEPRDSNDESK